MTFFLSYFDFWKICADNENVFFELPPDLSGG